ncbi:hypothetical protein [Dyadobacter sandarakinus]|uniref:Uncharacterized protein n=1 Tax=Dyadobacter sandarakinus TaxID=2747268 RepID=A0ABX7I4N2_9BACT|nr:hypothetical protein [Dyadobacter sandarakinus]QRR01046.1 hypothetical protein HWI92_09090 [Dyadobacter sandarakinus]
MNFSLKTLALLCILAASALSCSQTLQRRYDQRNGTYSDNYRSDRYSRTSRDDRDAYQRDYDRRPADRTSGTQDYSASGERLAAQYDEMDKLGDDILFEIDILDKRYDLLLDEYKSANKSGKSTIAGQLDRITDDRLVLYRAYTRIYRNGKYNWASVKSEVEDLLKSMQRNK